MERNSSSEIKSKELVLHDEEGTVIHAQIPSNIVPKFVDSFVEGNVYGVKNFYVVSNYHTYKTSMYEYMLQFNHETILKELRSDHFPWHMFRLRSFQSLKGNPDLNVKELIDIIGRVVQVYAPQEKTIQGNKTRLIDFVLEDAQGSKITCTFWDQHVSKIEHLYQSPCTEPVVVLIQFCRIKIGVRDAEVKICSSYDVTQCIFDLDCPEFTSFRESLRSIDHQTPIRNIASLSSFSYTNTVDESTSQAMELLTINQIYDNDE
ncbi:replication protein A 70 kDa DNA-binding subunit B-like [Ipomoea triloba]|uniref:replication protein A 70 kDa DNA-binding subunit B-like n=1 Tax=Ipomoea triloba TaxID=35885 RepID=UPI00125DEB8E|nr:replication protein A 70 kDa DNA-binding subunit B-like [Ipomoea triloba]